MFEQEKDEERRYRGMPTIYIAGDPPVPAPFLMSRMTLGCNDRGLAVINEKPARPCMAVPVEPISRTI